jgi:predicted transcriptional regulator
MNKTITVRLDEETSKKLKEIQNTDKRTLSEIVRDSIESYLIVKKFRSLRRKTLSYAEKAGLLTDEDIFEASR